MKFRKTLFFEIPSKNFILPIYTEDDVNLLKKFLQNDEALFSIGLKSKEENGYYYIGQVIDFTPLFRLKEIPIVYRKRILDVLKGFQENPQFIEYDLEPYFLKKIVYFQMTRNGPKVFMINDNEENLKKINKLDIVDSFKKDIEVFLISNTNKSDDIRDNEIFYRIKNPNY